MKKLLMFLAIGFVMQSMVFAAWVEQTLPAIGQPLNAVVMSDESTAVAVGDAGKIVRTTDYGQTWTAIISPVPAMINLNDVCAVPGNPSLLFAVGEDTSGLNSLTYTSTDGGINWVAVGSIANTNAEAITFVSSTVGWVCGDGGQAVWKTVDGGSTWNITNNGIALGVNYYDIQAIDANNLQVVGGGGNAFYTIDGGTNWIADDTDGTAQELYALHFINSSVGWIVGGSNDEITGNLLIRKQTAIGFAWEVQDSQITSISDVFCDVFFVDANIGYAVTITGKIVSTANGGTTWTSSGDAGEQLLGLNFLDAGNGYAVGGAAGKVFRWEVAPTVTAINPTQVGRGVTNYDIVVTGTDFQNPCSATITNGGENITVNSTTYNSPTSVTVNVDVPSGATTGAVWDIQITNTPNSRSGTGSNLLTVNNLPTISSINLNGKTSRYPGWSGSFTITGTNFVPASATLAFASANITVNSYSVDSATTITGTMTIGTTAGDFSFTVNNNDGNSVNSTMTVNPSMALSGVIPSTINLGTTVNDLTISGSGFLAGIIASDIVISAGTVNSITSVNSNSIVLSYTAPSAGIGAKNLTVTNFNGQVKTLPSALTINDPTVPPPVISSVSPTSGIQGNTLDVTISGSNFQAGATVTFSNSGITINSTTITSASITVNISIAAAATTGLTTVVVSNLDGGSASYGNAFTVISSGGGTDPTINNSKPIVPNFGIKLTSSSSSSSGLASFAITGDDRQSYAINGTNFGADMQVSFSSSSPATTSIMAPPAVPIPSQITVRTNADGTQQIIFFLNELTVPLGFYDIMIVDSTTGLSASKTRAFEVKDPTVVAANLPAAQAYPSPADPKTAGSISLQFEMAESVNDVYLWIYDISGALVQKIGPINTHTGSNTTEWDFIRIGGLKVGDGIYKFTVATGNKTFTSGKFAVHRRP